MKAGDYIKIKEKLETGDGSYKEQEIARNSGKVGIFYEYKGERNILFHDTDPIRLNSNTTLTNVEVIEKSQISDEIRVKLDKLYQIYLDKRDMCSEINTYRSRKGEIAGYMSEFLGKVYTKSTTMDLRATVDYSLTISPRVLRANINWHQRKLDSNSPNMVGLILDNADILRANIKDKRGHKFELFDKVINSIKGFSSAPNKTMLEKNGWTYVFSGTGLYSTPDESIIPNAGEAYRINWHKGTTMGEYELLLEFLYIKRNCERFEALPDYVKLPRNQELDDITEAIRLTRDYIKQLNDEFDAFKQDFRAIICAREA